MIYNIYMDGKKNKNNYLIKGKQLYNYFDNINLILKKCPKLISKHQKINFLGIQYFNAK